MNKQPIEKQHLRADGMLEVHSIFYTIQGEGPFNGAPAVFIRLAGCNLQCPLCDTDYTSKRALVSPLDILKLVQIHNQAATLVVITGGEPFRQNITPTTEALLDAGFRVQIESNGTLYLPGFPYNQVATVVSPKAGTINKRLAEHKGAIYAMKYIIQAGFRAPDGLPSTCLGHPASPKVARPPATFRGHLFLQPADEKDEVKNAANLSEAVESCLQHGYILGVQIHKLINKE